MRIYYYGELIEDTKNPSSKTEALKQTALDLESVRATRTPSADMQSIGDIIKELDLNLDSFRPTRLQSRGVQTLTM